ncbi:hypothetical protein LZC95_05295 [Pendulispora brunnea]|uniref:Terminase small subunit n=1 Tax=Pendulispora brunnea TaxID=2905690 RepID=A0ABZ2KFD6_9BACT
MGHQVKLRQKPSNARPNVSPQERLSKQLLFDTADLLEDVKLLTRRLRKELHLSAGDDGRPVHPAIEASRSAESALRQVRGLLMAGLSSPREDDSEEITPDDFL